MNEYNPVDAYNARKTGYYPNTSNSTDSAGNHMWGTHTFHANHVGIILIENGEYYYQTNYDCKLNDKSYYVATCRSIRGQYRYTGGYNTWKTTKKDPTLELYEKFINFCETTDKKEMTLEDICKIAVNSDLVGDHDVNLVFSSKTAEEYLRDTVKTLSVYKVPQYKGLFMILTSTEPENIIFCLSEKEET